MRAHHFAGWMEERGVVGMTYPWEYFENLNEVVYVSDPETYELVYLNQYARNILKVAPGEYKGKMCYTVLQGLDRPCPFCTNSRLEEGKFLSWSYWNPVVDTAFQIEDTMIVCEGKRYRLEFADPRGEQDPQKSNYNIFLHYETFVNECLRTIHSTDNQGQALDRMLEYLGTHLHCKAVSIYESKLEPWVVNTYMWSEDGALPDRHPMKIDYADYLKHWYEALSRNDSILFWDMNSLCQKSPGLCKFLRSCTLDRMIIVPLLEGQKVLGFLRLDNPPEEQMNFAAGVCKVLSYYILSVLRQRNLIESLEQASCHDQLTGALNRHAINDLLNRPGLEKDTGLIYCDVVGLKSVNDQQGHASGDRLILQVYHLLGGVFPHDRIYRLGGDEFLVVCQGKPREIFHQNVDHLREELADSGCELSVGSAWAPAGDSSFQRLLERADALMYEDKKKQYAGKRQGNASGGWWGGETTALAKQSSSRLREFLQSYYFDVDSFFRSVALVDTSLYLYCGDLRQNIYYISDNLKEEFDFEDNLVYNFVERLEERIYGPDRMLHQEDMREMYAEKRENHYVRYRIHDKNGNLVWMRCQGIIKWDREKNYPIFFSGSMMRLKNEAEIDSVTGLMHISYAVRKLPALHQWSGNMTLLCIVCQNFSDINRAFGRNTGDTVLLEASEQLERELEGQIQLFRMDGPRFLAVANGMPDAGLLAKQIQHIIKGIYHKYGIELMYPCAIGVLHGSGGTQVPQTLVDHAGVAAHIAKSYPGLDYVEFSPQMLKPYQDRSDMNLALNFSVNHDFQGFRVVVQPQVRAGDGSIFGGEVLLRWQNQGENVTPDKFIPVLEQTGLIIPVGKWILEQAMIAAKQILTYQPDFLISVNVSYLQIMDRTLFSTIQGLLKQYGVSPRNLLLELTETHFDEMPDYLEQFVQQCGSIGIQFALDDFGKAYSFLQLLLQYPADLVKLDRSLTVEITSSEEKRSFMQSIVYACHKFGKKVCVEGVETIEEFRVVQRMECDFVQGFYFYRPMELPDLNLLLEQTTQTTVTK